jgi:hypothetical protein
MLRFAFFLSYVKLEQYFLYVQHFYSYEYETNIA